MSIKNLLFKYGDKAIFAVFLLILVWSATKFISNQAPGDSIVKPKTKSTPIDPEIIVESDSIAIKQRITSPLYSDAGNDIATDPEKIEPKEGEVACPGCDRILPDTFDVCPICGTKIKNKVDPEDTDNDGLPDKWEMKYWGDLSHGPEEDFDEDEYTNKDEYEGGSDPTDPKSIPSPFTIAEIGQEPVDILFKGYIVHEGGDSNKPDAAFWAIEINWGRGTQTKIIPYKGYFHGYKLDNLVKKVETREVKGIGPVDFDEWFLTIQKKGRKPIIAQRNKEVREQELYVRLRINRGRDRGQITNKLYDGDKFMVNGDEYTVGMVMEDQVTVFDKNNKMTTIQKNK